MEDARLEKKREADRRWYQQNKEIIAERKREQRLLWRKANPEKDRENGRRCKQRNAAKRRERDWEPDARYSSYEKAAAKRGYAFDLTKDEFNRITSEACFYCGCTGKMGVDRFDNSKGYLQEPGQCVPCCSWCNRAKSDSAFEEMLERLKGIVAKHGPKQ